MNKSSSTQKSFWLLCAFCVVLGVLLHFAFDWSNGSALVALFAPVNESIWEHEKLLFFPFAIGAYTLARRQRIPMWAFSCMLSLLVGLTFIPCAYYTYTGALGVGADWFNIVIFIAAVLITTLVYAWIIKISRPLAFPPALGELFLFLLLLLFVIFTFMPPRIPLFQDPVDGSYGFWGKM